MSGEFQWPGADEREPQGQWQKRKSESQSRAGEMEAPPSLVVPRDRVYVPHEEHQRPEDLIIFAQRSPPRPPPTHTWRITASTSSTDGFSRCSIAS